LNEIIAITIGAILSWINFVIIDIWMGLPESPGVRGAGYFGKPDICNQNMLRLPER